MTAPSNTDILRTLRDAQRSGGDRLDQKAIALERLLVISQEISVLDLPTVLRLILHHILDWTGTRQGAILLAEGDRGLRVEVAVGLDREELVDIEFQGSRSVALRALETGEIVIIEDAPASPHRNQASVLDLGLQALLALPLRVRDRVIGVIYLATNSSNHRVRQLDVSILSAFAAQAAVALENARLHQRLKEDHYLLQRSVKDAYRIDNILYRSPAMHRVALATRQVASSDVTVLISGETGTGKELIARAIHYNSGRRNRRFLSQNAGALPDTLLESELFGHRRGAFSGALDNKTGLFEAADGGTVFLDEIGEASPAFQVRLLRFLETGTFRRLGETTDRQVNVRIVTATHRNLEEEVQAGRFRADLFYRVSIFPIHLPPLRERRRYRAADRSLHRPVQRRSRTVRGDGPPRGQGGSAGTLLARERPRASERDPTADGPFFGKGAGSAPRIFFGAASASSPLPNPGTSTSADPGRRRAGPYPPCPSALRRQSGPGGPRACAEPHHAPLEDEKLGI